MDLPEVDYITLFVYLKTHKKLLVGNLYDKDNSRIVQQLILFSI